MPTPFILYIASILGAVALWLMMPKRKVNWKPLGALIGVSVLGAAWLLLSTQFEFWTQLPGPPWDPTNSPPPPPGFGGPEKTGIDLPAFGFHYVFGFISLAAAVAVITNKRPVYAALWFVMVVLSSAGLFLTLEAEFIAFAMVIIYGGAILVTYMFVIMLASEQQQSSNFNRDAPEYERIAREPLAAVAAGFLLLAVLLNISFEPMTRVESAKADTDAAMLATTLTGRTEDAAAEKGLPLTAEQAAVLNAPEGSEAATATLSNVERVGIDLFTSHPLGLELAGIILLVALIGAVVIAKTQVYDEDDVETPSAEASA